MDYKEKPVDKYEEKKLKNRIAVANYKRRRQEFIEKLKKQLVKQIKECQMLKYQNVNLENKNQLLQSLLEQSGLSIHEKFKSFENRLNTRKDDQTDLNPTLLQLKRPKSPPEESKQIVLKKPRNIETIYSNPSTLYLVGAENFNSIELTDFGVVAFRNMPEDSMPKKFYETSPKDFSNKSNFIEKFYQMMPLRRVSSEKIAFLYSLITCNEEHQSSTLRRLTFIVPNVMKEISLHNLKGHFDDNLVNLYNKIPANAFYYVKSWINLDFDHKIQKDVSYDFDYTFYSPFVMDIEMTSIMYIFGKPIVVMQCTLSRTEATDGSSKYYIYQAKLPYDSGFIDELTRLKNKYGYKLVQKVLENQTRLIILTDQQTNDPIFALARKSEYVPNFTGYQFCRVV